MRKEIIGAATLERQKTRAALEALKTVPQLIAEADRAFCAWVRARDAGLPCICCGETAKSSSLTGGEWDAGHYRSRGAASHLRYHPDNASAQRKQCNRHAFDVASYRANLIARIGLERVEALEQHKPARPISRTLCPDGTTVLEVGDTVMILSPRESRMIGELMAGSSQQYAAIEIGHEAARLNAVLQAQISDVRREVARMGPKAEDE